MSLLSRDEEMTCITTKFKSKLFLQSVICSDENNGLRRHRTRKKVFELTTTYSKSKSRSVKKSVTVVDSQDSVSQETCNDSNNTNDDGLTSSGSQPLQSHNHMYSNTERCISDDDAVTLLLRFKHTVLLKSDPYNSFKSNPLVVYSPVPCSHIPVNVFQSNHLTNCNSNHFQYTPTFSKNAFQLS